MLVLLHPDERKPTRAQSPHRALPPWVLFTEAAFFGFTSLQPASLWYRAGKPTRLDLDQAARKRAHPAKPVCSTLEAQGTITKFIGEIPASFCETLPTRASASRPPAPRLPTRMALAPTLRAAATSSSAELPERSTV